MSSPTRPDRNLALELGGAQYRLFTPYPWNVDAPVKVGTLVYAPSLALDLAPELPYADLLAGQVTLVRSDIPWAGPRRQLRAELD
jgi:hypothetical protein